MLHTIIEQPLYNILVLITSVLPTHDLGLAIILLTLLIKTILLGPTLKGMKAGTKMQEIQPKLKEIQEKYKGNQTKISEETMKLWKEHKVNPFGSCLPILIQMPILFGLFYVIKSDIAASASDVYPFLEGIINVNSINPFFLGFLDLGKPETMFLPVILGILQYFQIRLSFAGNKSQGKEQKTMQQVMSFMFPTMIMFMAVKFQSGVALYWLTSTLYAIFQQFYINKQKKKMKVDSPLSNLSNAQEATIISEKEVKKNKKNKAITISEKVNLEDKAIERAKEKEVQKVKNKIKKKNKVNVTRIEI